MSDTPTTKKLLTEIREYLRQQEETAAARTLPVNERPVEYAFTLAELTRLSCRTVLDVGTGRTAFPAVLRQCGFSVTASDSKGRYWPEFYNHHIWVHTLDVTDPVLSDMFDAVVAVSCIEHIPNAEAAVRGMTQLTKPGGTLILTFPYSHSTYVEDVYKLPDADTFSKDIPYICQSFSAEEIARWKDRFNLTELRRVYFRGWTGEYWRTGERLDFAREVPSPDEANGLCISLRFEGYPE